MRLFTYTFLLTATVFLGATFETWAQPTISISNVNHACGGQSNGSFQINVTAATGPSLRVRVIGVPPFTDIDQTIPMPALPFAFPVSNLPGANGGRSYLVIVSDTDNATAFVNIFNFTVTQGVVTQNTNPGCATPNGAITVNLAGSSPKGPITFSWTGPGGPYATQNISGLSGGDYTLSYSDGSTTCTLGPIHINDPSPTAFTISSAAPNICNGGVITVDVSTADNGYTYDVMEGATVLASAAGAGGPLSIPVPGLASGSHTLRVRASAGVCPPRFNDPSDLSVTVNPTPDYNNYNNTAAPGGTCSGVALGVNLSTLKKPASVAATSYDITAISSTSLTATAGSPATGTGLAATVISDDVWQNLTNGNLDVVYTIVPVTNSCPGAPFTVTVTIKPQPDYNSYNNDALPGGICSGTALGVALDPLKKATSLLATSYNITAISSTGLTATGGSPATGTGLASNVLADDQWQNVSNVSHDVVYTIVPVTGGCNGTPFTVTVTINPQPDYNSLTVNPAICSGDLVGVDLSTLQKGTSIAATSFNITSIVSTGLTAAGGSPATGNGLAASVIADDQWKNVSNANVNVVYTIAPVVGSCVGSSFTVTVPIKPQPDYNNGAPAAICSGVATAVDFIAFKKPTSIAATSYNITSIVSTGLTATGGAPTTGTGFTSTEIADDVWQNIGTTPLTAVYTVIPVDGTCLGDPFTVTVSVNPEPQGSNYADNNAPGGICSGDALAVTLTTSPTAVAAATYNITSIVSTGLTAAAGSPATGNGFAANVIADDAWTNATAAPLTVTYTVVPVSAANCVGAPFTVLVTINPRPDYNNYNNTLQPGGICAAALGIDLSTLQKPGSIAATTFNITSISSSSLTAVAGNPATGNGLLANEIADDVWSNTTAASHDVVYTIVPVTGTCTGNSFTVTVTIKPQPDYANSPVTVCSPLAVGVSLDATKAPTSVVATSFDIISINTAAGLTAVAGSPSTGTGVASNEIANDQWQNLTNGPLTVIYKVVPFSGTCAGASFDVTVTVNPEPTYANYNNDAAPTGICSEDVFGLDLQTQLSPVSVSATTFDFSTVVGVGLTPVGSTALSGTGTSSVLADDQWRNTTNAPLTVVYTVTPKTAAGCVGNSFTVTLTINPQPDYNNFTLPASICGTTPIGVDLSTLKKASSVTATTYNITSIVATGLTATAGAPAVANGVTAIEISDDTWQNLTAVSHDVVYTVVPVIGTCTGDPFTVTATILPQPDYNNYNNNAAPGGICSDALITVNLATLAKGTSVVATTYNIDAITATGLTATAGSPATGTGLAANVIADDRWQNLTSGPLDVVYTITPFNGACAGAQFTVTVTILPEPVSAAVNKSICNNSSAAFDLQVDAINATGNGLAGVSFSWIATDNTNVAGESLTTQTSASIADVLVNNTAVSQSVTYTVTPTSAAGCAGAPFQVVIDVTPQPVLAAGQNVQACSGVSVGYEILLSPVGLPVGTTFSWPDPDGAGPATAGVNVPMGAPGTTHINDVLINTAVAPLVVTYVVTPSIGGGCVGAPQNVVVNVNRSATSNAGSDQAICTGSGPYTLVGSSVGGAASVGSWTVFSQPSGGDGVVNPLTPLANPATATFSATVTGDYVLALTTDDPAGICGPAVDFVTITVSPIPAIAAGQVKTICGNDPIAYEILMNPANTPANTVFNWPDPDGSGPATAGVNVAMGTPGTLHLNDVLLNNGTANITVTYVVTPSVGLCVGSPQNIVITVRPSPVVAFGQTKTICSGDQVNYEILLNPVNQPAGTTFSWPDPDGAGPGTSKLNVAADPAGTLHITDQLFNGTGAPIHVIYSVISKGSNGCTGVTRDIDIVVNSGAIVDAGNAQAICSGGTATLAGASIGGLATTGTWSIINSPTGGDGVLTPATPTATPATATFKATIAGDYTLQLSTDDPAGPCNAVSDVVVITVKSPADPSCTGGSGTCATVVITPVPSPATCNNSDGGIVFDIVPPVPIINNTGVRIDIVGNGPTNLTISRTNFNNYSFSGLPVGTYNYTIEYGDPSCIKTGTVTIDRSGTIGTPVANNLIDPICSGPPFGTATIDAPGETGHQLEWSIDGITWSPFIAGQPVSGIPGGTNIVSVRRDSSDPCASGVVVVLANPTPVTASFAATDATCNNNDGSIVVSNLAGGTGPYTFTLNGTAVNLPQNNTFAGLTANAYTIVVTDSKGCATTFAPVNVSFPGFINYTPPVTTAPDCTGAGGNGKVDFSITDPGSFQFALTTNLIVEPALSAYNTLGGSLVSVSNLSNGDYALWLRPLGAGTKCATKVTFTISGVYAVSYAGTTSDVVCFGQTTSIQVTSLTGAPGLPFNYTLTNTGDNSVATGTITASQALSTYSITGVGAGKYSLVIRQDQSSLVASCTTPVSGPALPFTVNGPSANLDSLYVKRAISFPDLPSGSALVGVKPSGLEPYEVRLELTSPLFAAQQFVADWSQVALNPQNLKFEKSFTNLYAGEYTLGIRDAGGCEKTYKFTLNVDTNLFIPNIFTPNSDGHNDVFYIRNLPADANLLITNRWGKEVYKSASYQNDWNGGDTVDGLYYYTLKLNGQSFTGWVEILRGE